MLNKAAFDKRPVNNPRRVFVAFNYENANYPKFKEGISPGKLGIKDTTEQDKSGIREQFSLEDAYGSASAEAMCFC